jgi:PST family polysaccharide transporter
MQDKSTANEYHALARTGMKLLIARQVAVQIASLVGNVVLARVLGPTAAGLYLISAYIVNLFGLIADFGIAPSLIQRKEVATPLDLRVAFTLQQVVSAVLSAALFLSASALTKSLYPGTPQVAWLIRALSISLYLTSWRTMSALQLERQLKYQSIAKVEVLETLLYQVLAVGLALRGFGVWSYVVATLVQGIFGALLLYAASPWPVRFGFDRPTARALIRFGVPFQFQTILNQMGGWVTPVLVGRVVGPAGVGFVTWASSNGRKPIMLVDSVMRVAFPLFSRIQGDIQEVERTITRYLGILLFPSALWFTLICVSVPGCIDLLYKSRWDPAAFSLVLFSAALILDVMSWVIGVALNGIGRVREVTVVVSIRAIANILLSVCLVLRIGPQFGFNGVAIGYLFSSLFTVPWLAMSIAPGAMRRIFSSLVWLLPPLACGCTVGKFASLATMRFPLSVHVTLSATGALVAYLAVGYVVGPEYIRRRLSHVLSLGLAVLRRNPNPTTVASDPFAAVPVPTVAE